MLKMMPITAAGRVVMKKTSNETCPLEFAAMNAFCGFPKNVEALPMFADVAMPSRSGKFPC